MGIRLNTRLLQLLKPLYQSLITTKMPNKSTNARQRLQKEVAALQRQLANTTLQTGKRKRKRRGGGNGGSSSVPAAMCSSPQVKAKGRAKRGGSSVGNGGRIVLSRDELLVTVATTKSVTESVFSKDLVPSSGVMPFLFRLSSCYQRIRWLRARITWRPSCGTSTNGIISYGVAFNNSTSITSRDLVVALTPCNDHPVWQSSGSSPLNIPAEMLMSRKWYPLNAKAEANDISMGRFCVGLTHDSGETPQSRGEFWISYSVEMEGTNPA
uniref:Capsid protein n=1 Tax=Suncus murinus ribovirus 4 TaxID=3139578 RepID=A0AB38ZKG1_9VIRU